MKAWYVRGATIGFTVLVFNTFFPHPAYAQVDLTQLFPWARKFPTLGALISTLLPNILLFAGIFLIILSIISGFRVMQSGGSGDAESTGKSKQALTYAVMGFLIIFTSFWIIQIIEFLTGVNIFNPGL